jgi:predicted metal-dependent hydrolase
MRTIPPSNCSVVLRHRLSELLKEALKTEKGTALLYLLRSFADVARGQGQAAVSRNALVKAAERVFCDVGIAVAVPAALDELLTTRLLRSMSQEGEQTRLALGEELQTELSAATHRIEAYCLALESLSRRPRRSIGLVERALEEAACLFNEGLFFEVHEVLEAVWLTEWDGVRRLLQGLIQIAVGFHHLESNNPRGALSLLQEGVEKVKGYGPDRSGLELDRFLAQVENARRSIESLGEEAFDRFDRQMIPQMQLLESTMEQSE